MVPDFLPSALFMPCCLTALLPYSGEPEVPWNLNALVPNNAVKKYFHRSFLLLNWPKFNTANMSIALDNSLPALLSTLMASLGDAVSILPKETALLPSKDGLSLLDTKNELFLSYVQNLVFLILVKLRHTSLKAASDEQAQDVAELNHDVVKKLAELRLYLDKGVKPLEARLKYQVDKIIKAADEVNQPRQLVRPNKNIAVAHGAVRGQDESDSNASDSNDSGSEDDSDASEDIDELSYRPNPAALLRPADVNRTGDGTTRKDEIYRPPRITATSLPTTVGKNERAARRPAKSATIDEFIATELSSAPMVEPSIGSTIRAGGRRTMSQREQDEYAEKKAYEESNMIRLPRESKKDKSNKYKNRDGGFGGEEWRNLGIGLDRIDKLTKKQTGSGGQLANSRKRAVQDGPRDSGEQFGQQFAKRQKGMSKRTR